MNTTQCFYKLDTNINGILKINLKDNFKDVALVQSYDNKEWVNFFEDKFINRIERFHPITRLMVFNTPSYHTNPVAHVDVPNRSHALNVVFTSTLPETENQSYMEWFKIVKHFPKYTTNNEAKTEFIPYSESELELIERGCIDFSLSVVRVDIPHRIKIGKGYRTCFSFRVKDEFTSWEEALSFYREMF